MEQFRDILFVDIETVPILPDFNLLTERMQYEWARKAKFLKSENIETASPGSLFSEKAGIFSEFAKVVCICIGSFQKQGEKWVVRLKSITNDDEKELLNDFCGVIGRFSERYPNFRFCGHNIKEFDIPFLGRRMLINGLSLPDCMQLAGKKPWEVGHIDTMELWKFGDYKHFTSLSLLAEILGIPSPKDDMDGSMVAGVYWQDKDLPRIAKYCLQDVLTSAKVFLKLKGINNINPTAIVVND